VLRVDIASSYSSASTWVLAFESRPGRECGLSVRASVQ